MKVYYKKKTVKWVCILAHVDCPVSSRDKNCVPQSKIDKTIVDESNKAIAINCLSFSRVNSFLNLNYDNEHIKTISLELSNL